MRCITELHWLAWSTLSVVEAQAVTPKIVAREKAQALRKGGILEVVETCVDLDAVGGMDVLKSWLVNRQQAFTDRAVAYGLPCLIPFRTFGW